MFILSQQIHLQGQDFYSVPDTPTIILVSEKETEHMKYDPIPYKIYLTEDEMPRAWYNLRADMKNKPAPLLNPDTMKPMTAEELSAVFCEELVKQELDDTTPFFEIPEYIRNFYRMYRPSPLVRAYCLEEKLQIRGQQHLRQPQAQFRHRAGLLCQAAGSQGRDHRDRRRPVGHRPLHGMFLFRAGLQGLHGQVLL